MSWEIDFLNNIQKTLQCGVLDQFFRYFTQLGSAVAVIILAAALLIPKKTRKIGLCMGIALLFGILFGNAILKNLVGRQRPYTQEAAMIREAALLIKPPSGDSFPSGHTLGAFNAALSFFWFKKKWGLLAIAGACLIAFSRLYLYVHYPTDIIGGILLALICSLLAFYIVKALSKRFDKYLG